MRIEVTSDRPPVSPRRRTPAWVWIVSAALVAAAVTGAWWAGIPLPTALISAVVLLVLLVGAGFAGHQLVLRAKRTVGVIPGARHWLVTDEQIEVTGAATTMIWQWPVVATVQVTRDAYVFRQRGGQPLDLPRAPLDAAQEAELAAHLRSLALP